MSALQYRLHLGTSSQRVTRWRNIEDSTPVLASRGRVRLEFRSDAPSIVAELPATEPVKTESEG